VFFICYGGENSYVKFWTLFGASNQLLAALTLIVVSVWLLENGKSAWFTLVPMAFVLVITLWALGTLAWTNLRASAGFDVALANGVAAAALVLLALFLLVSGMRALVRARG
jgi:carbon starvation protein